MFYTVDTTEILDVTFQRDKNTEDHKEVYLYNDDDNDWIFSSGSVFHAKTRNGWIFLDSTGKE